MNRRSYLAAAGTAAAGLFGYAGVRVADLRPYDPDLPAGETPNERIVDAARHRYAADHRAITTVTVTRDSAGESGYRVGRVREHHEHSRRKHCYVLTTERAPPQPSPQPYQGLLGLFHWTNVTAESLPTSSVVYLTDSESLQSWTAPAPESVTTRPELGAEPRHSQQAIEDSGMFRNVLRPHDAAWTTVDSGTYELTDRDAYAKAVVLPRQIERLSEGCRVRVTLDGNGRLSRVVDDCAVIFDPRALADDDERGDLPASRTVTFRRVTAFDRYGTATAPRPTGSVDVDPGDRLRTLLTDLTIY
ncbi:hypothetical protein [Haloarcula halophila]|uniref:hypothetical protein n=1 Tax=Haloarcula TaxID=2237 RepID=UPI0023E3CB4A|nr:hypothetical protein [Halomicroarcula sp. DFY41]